MCRMYIKHRNARSFASYRSSLATPLKSPEATHNYGNSGSLILHNALAAEQTNLFGLSRKRGKRGSRRSAPPNLNLRLRETYIHGKFRGCIERDESLHMLAGML
jgi:hypothetical protein